MKITYTNPEKKNAIISFHFLSVYVRLNAVVLKQIYML